MPVLSYNVMGRLQYFAKAQDKVLERLQRAKVQGECGPVLNKKSKPEVWLNKPGSPKAKLANEKPQGETVPYEQLLKAWKEGKVR